MNSFYVTNFLGIPGITFKIDNNNYLFLLNFLENRNTTVYTINNTVLYKAYSSDFVQITEHGVGSITPHSITFNKFKSEAQKVKNLIKIFTISQTRFPFNLSAELEENEDDIVNQDFIVDINIDGANAIIKYTQSVRDQSILYFCSTDNVIQLDRNTEVAIGLNDQYASLYLCGTDKRIIREYKNRELAELTIRKMLDRYERFANNIIGIANNCM